MLYVTYFIKQICHWGHWDSADKMDARESPFEILFYGLPSLKAMQSRETHVFSDRVGTTDCALLAPPRRSKILTRKLRRHMVDR